MYETKCCTTTLQVEAKISNLSVNLELLNANTFLGTLSGRRFGGGRMSSSATSCPCGETEISIRYL